MCGRLLTQRGRAIRMSQNVALPFNRFPKRKTECPVFVFKKYGHQQLPHFDVLSSFGSSMRGPHRLTNHRASIYDAVVK